MFPTAVATANNGESVDSAFATLQYAANTVSAGDSVFVSHGNC